MDRVLARLRAGGAERIVVDGGGDLAVAGASWPIGVGADRFIELRDGAVATSSTLGRRWRDERGNKLHHILDPKTGAPARSGLDTATVRAPNATTADALATALLVDAHAVLPLLPNLRAESLVRERDGTWWSSPGWEVAA